MPRNEPQPPKNAQSQVDEAWDGLEKSVDKAEQAMHSLGERIERVLIPCGPTETCGTEKNANELCPLATLIREMAFRVEKLADRIRYTEQRVEL